MNNLKWITENGRIDQNSINKVENYFNIKLPSDYIECILKNNGGYPVPNQFTLNGKGEIFNNLISLEGNNLLDVYQDVSNQIDIGIVPFAEDPFGNLICFDYRKGEIPSIVFWEHELASEENRSAFKFICKTFSDLLDMLHKDN